MVDDDFLMVMEDDWWPMLNAANNLYLQRLLINFTNDLC